MQYVNDIRLLLTVPGMLLALFGTVTPASAQVLQIEDDGKVIVSSGPVVTTSSGIEPIALTLPTTHANISGSVRSASAHPVGPLASIFQLAAQDFGVDTRLLHAVAWHESRFRQTSVSPKGAIGIMQLMPDTARQLGVDPNDVTQNVRGGAYLLAQLLRDYRGNIDLALAAYNAGPAAVRRYGGIPPFAETRSYVARIRQVLPF